MSHLRVEIFDLKNASFNEIYSAVVDENSFYKSSMDKDFKDYLLYYALGFQKEERFSVIVERPNRDYDLAIFYYNIVGGNKIKRIYMLLEELNKGSVFVNGYEYVFLESVDRTLRYEGKDALDDLVANTLLVHGRKTYLPYKIGCNVKTSKNYFLYLDSETSLPLFELSFSDFKSKKFVPRTNFGKMYEGTNMSEKEMFYSFMSIFLTFINSFEDFGYVPKTLIYNDRVMFVDKIKNKDKSVNCLMVVENEPMVIFGYEEPLFLSLNRFLEKNIDSLDFNLISNRKKFSSDASILRRSLEQFVFDYFSSNAWSKD